MSFARYTKSDGQATIVFYHDSELYRVDDQHPRFDEIFELTLDLEDFEAAVELVDLKRGIATSFDKVSDRVSIAGDDVYFDGEPVHGELIDRIIEYYDSGAEFKPLVNFMEKLYVNTNSDSIDHLFRWIADRDLTITPDGDFVAYKGVAMTNDGRFVSKASGTAIVDGVVHTGNIPNAIGTTVEMPRSQVTFDPDNHCSVGLHAGVWDYASTWGEYVLTVVINPRDVVSVPHDHSSQKLRTCRYRVTGITESPLKTLLYDDVADDLGGPDDDGCTEDGYCDDDCNCYTGPEDVNDDDAVVGYAHCTLGPDCPICP